MNCRVGRAHNFPWGIRLEQARGFIITSCSSRPTTIPDAARFGTPAFRHPPAYDRRRISIDAASPAEGPPSIEHLISPGLGTEAWTDAPSDLARKVAQRANIDFAHNMTYIRNPSPKKYGLPIEAFFARRHMFNDWDMRYLRGWQTGRLEPLLQHYLDKSARYPLWLYVQPQGGIAVRPKAVVRTTATRRLSKLFREALRLHGYDGDGRPLVVDHQDEQSPPPVVADKQLFGVVKFRVDPIELVQIDHERIAQYLNEVVGTLKKELGSSPASKPAWTGERQTGRSKNAKKPRGTKINQIMNSARR